MSILGRIGWTLTILDDFINQPYHIDNIQNSENFKWPWPLTFIWPWPWVWPLMTIWRNIFFSIFFHFLWSHVTQKRDLVRQNGWSLTESPFYKEHFAANQKSVPLPVQNVMAHYVIFIEFINVTWRKGVTSYVKTEHLSQKRNFIRNVLQPTRSLCHFRFKSYGPLCDFHKSGDLDDTSISNQK